KAVEEASTRPSAIPRPYPGRPAGPGQGGNPFWINWLTHLAVNLQRSADDETVGQAGIVADVLPGDTAAQENLRGRARLADAIEIGDVGRVAGARPRND